MIKGLKVIAPNAVNCEKIRRFDLFEREGSYGEHRGVVYLMDGVVKRITHFILLSYVFPLSSLLLPHE
jgi:hypothetical protein